MAHLLFKTHLLGEVCHLFLTLRSSLCRDPPTVWWTDVTVTQQQRIVHPQKNLDALDWDCDDITKIATCMGVEPKMEENPQNGW